MKDGTVFRRPAFFRYNDFQLYNEKSVKGGLLIRPPKNVTRHVHVGHAHLARSCAPLTTRLRLKYAVGDVANAQKMGLQTIGDDSGL